MKVQKNLNTLANIVVQSLQPCKHFVEQLVLAIQTLLGMGNIHLRCKGVGIK
jgi:hypothetical protein